MCDKNQSSKNKTSITITPPDRLSTEKGRWELMHICSYITYNTLRNWHMPDREHYSNSCMLLVAVLLLWSLLRILCYNNSTATINFVLCLLEGWKKVKWGGLAEWFLWNCIIIFIMVLWISINPWVQYWRYNNTSTIWALQALSTSAVQVL